MQVERMSSGVYVVRWAAASATSDAGDCTALVSEQGPAAAHLYWCHRCGASECSHIRAVGIHLRQDDGAR